MLIKNAINSLSYKYTTKLEKALDKRRVVSLKPENKSQGNVLLSYKVKPFLLEKNNQLPNTHTHYWESLQMAKTFLGLNYSVDVIDFENKYFLPNKNYDFFIDVRWNMQRLAPKLNKDCIKIMHLDTANIMFHDTAELQRLLALQQRRGITLRPRRFENPNLGVHYADYLTLLGNEFTINTYKYANKPIYRIPISTTSVYPYPETKDFESCRKNFLLLSSGGLINKGLDLVLEAFASMPDYHVFICAPIKKEEDFEKAFEKELYNTPNIHTIGWIDVDSQDFLDLAKNCLGTVFFSCSEGGGGSVITCMHAGLIPIVSYEASVDVNDDFGIVLQESSLDKIQLAIKTIANLPVEKLQEMSRKSWNFARENHTREKFAQVYLKTIKEIMATHQKLFPSSLKLESQLDFSFGTEI